MQSDDEYKDGGDIIQVLFSCSTYLDRSDLMNNIESIFEPFKVYSETDKIININMINAYGKDKEGEDKYYKKSKEKIKEVANKLRLNVIVNPIIYDRFIDHIFKLRFFYDYICFIGCNNINFIFSFFADDDDNNEKIETPLLAKMIGKDKDYFEIAGFAQYAITENLNLFIKPSTKLLFFEGGRFSPIYKYWDTLTFHRHLLDPENEAKKHADIFLNNFSLNYTVNGIPYFILK